MAFWAGRDTVWWHLSGLALHRVDIVLVWSGSWRVGSTLAGRAERTSPVAAALLLKIKGKAMSYPVRSHR